MAQWHRLLAHHFYQQRTVKEILSQHYRHSKPGPHLIWRRTNSPISQRFFPYRWAAQTPQVSSWVIAQSSFIFNVYYDAACLWKFLAIWKQIIYDDIMAWLLRSPTSRLFTQPCIQVQIKENIKALRHWPLCGEFTEFPTQSASNAENVSIWWSHHAHAFRNTGPWWGSTGYRWIPHESQLSWALMFSLFVSPNKLLNKRSNCRWFQTPWLPCAVTVIPLNSSVRNTSHGPATNRSCNFVLFSCFKDQFVNYENKWILLNCLIQYAQHNLHFYFRWWLFNENKLNVWG